MISGIGSLAPSAFGTSGLSLGQGADAKPAGLGGAQGSFAATLADLATHAAGSMREAEHVSTLALQGKADTREVVDAVMGAEQAFQTAVAIRDKIVTAYLEVSRMAI